MPAYYPYDRSQYPPAPPFPAPPFPAPPFPAPPFSSHPPPVTAYTALDHALSPERPSQSTTIHHTPSHPAQQPSQMASDGRYVYHNPQDVPAPYGYAPYSASPYSEQFPQQPGRPPVRAPSSQAHSPHQPPQAYHPPPPPYPQPPYGAPYGVPPPPGAQWTGEGWQHYSPYPPPHPPGQEVSYGPNGAPPNGNEHRGYPPGPSRPDSHRSDERQSRPPESAPSGKLRKAREGEPAAPPIAVPALGLDFVKLMDSYRLVMDSTAGFVHEATPPRAAGSAESVERMLQAATYGSEALDSAYKRAAADAPRPPSERNPDEGDDNAPKARQSENPPVVEGQTCLGCSATSTPEWRRGPMGPRTLCNACGLVYAKLIKKRNRDFTRGRAGSQASKPGPQGPHNPMDDSAAASSGEGGSDDDDSYGSQDRRSDGGYHGRD